MCDGDQGFRIDGTGRPYVLRPWVGPQYWNQKPRILVHGDSYYATEGPNSIECWRWAAENGTIENETIKQIQDVIQAWKTRAEDADSCNLRKSPLYRGIVQAIIGRANIKPEDVETAFGQIAFNNYVHVPMGKSYRRPTPEQFEIAKRVYQCELRELKPHLSLVLARRVWNNLPEGGSWSDCATERRTWKYSEPGNVLVGWLKHPSTFWRKNGWRDEAEIGIAQQYKQCATKFHGLGSA